MMRKKLATAPMLKRRARRHAIKLVRKRFMGKKGENYAKLGMADKIMIDTRVATKKAIIDRIAARLLPKVRRAELVRLRDYKKNKQAAAKKPTSGIKKPAPAPAKRPIVKYKGPPPTSSTQQAVKTSSYAIPKNVKTESYVTEDNIIDVVDMLSMLSEKDQKSMRFQRTLENPESCDWLPVARLPVGPVACRTGCLLYDWLPVGFRVESYRILKNRRES